MCQVIFCYTKRILFLRGYFEISAHTGGGGRRGLITKKFNVNNFYFKKVDKPKIGGSRWEGAI